MYTPVIRKLFPSPEPKFLVSERIYHPSEVQCVLLATSETIRYDPPCIKVASKAIFTYVKVFKKVKQYYCKIFLIFGRLLTFC